MPNSAHADNSNYIGDLVNHTVFADPNPPVVPAAAQLPAARRPWILRERRNAVDYLVVHAGRKPAQIFLCGTLEEDLKHALSCRRDIR